MNEFADKDYRFGSLIRPTPNSCTQYEAQTSTCVVVKKLLDVASLQVSYIQALFSGYCVQIRQEYGLLSDD